MEDFSFFEFAERKRKIGMPYFLRNQKGELEQYHLTNYTNAEDLAIFIKQEKCFVLKRESLIKN
jgi:hypothetical protein